MTAVPTRGHGVVRLAGTADLDRASAVIEAAFGAEGRRPALSRPETDALIRRRTLNLLEADGRLLGLIALEPLADHLFLPVVAVDPAYRRQGHGRRLIEFAAGEARRRHQRVLRLYADPMDASGSAFYRRVGFRPEPIQPDGLRQERIVLIRRLD